MTEIVQVNNIQILSTLISSNIEIQISLVILVVGLLIIFSIYFKFSQWIGRLKFSYTSPHFSRFIRKIILPFFALVLVSTVNFYIQIFESFDKSQLTSSSMGIAEETLVKILNTFEILVIGYTLSQIIPIILRKKEKSYLLKEDYEIWKSKRGFLDDPCGGCDNCQGKKYGPCENPHDFFHELFRWVPPSITPDSFTDVEFKDHLKTKKGREYLENYTLGGSPIGSYEIIVKNPFKIWKEHDKKKYLKYFSFCLSGNNASGRKLDLAARPREVYPIDDWRAIRRLNGYEYIVPGGKPPGYFEQRQKSTPRSLNQIFPFGIFVLTILWVAAWWGVDLVVLATATGGLGIGVGLALKQTMENYFAYLMIRKERIIEEGDRIQLNSGYNGYVHRITPRVTYVRNALNESLASVPTFQLINEQILNFTKEFTLVPAIVNVGASYLNNPNQVASVLMKCGVRTMQEALDAKQKHMVTQKRCPYLDENRQSCGCDQNILVDIEQPVVRFNNFNDSSLDFSVWVYARDFATRSKVETYMRMIIYDEFKKYNIKIPWPTRTIYQNDEKKEVGEIAKFDTERNEILDKYGMGDILHKK